jgi:hypothetical protein
VPKSPGEGRPRAHRIVAGALVTTLGFAAGLLSESTVTAHAGRVAAGRVVRVSVPEAIGGKTVIGQLTVDNASEPGFVTAYGCEHGIPHDSSGGINRSDVNYDGRITPVASNRLIVQADSGGDVCFYTSRRIDMIVDVNAVSFDVGINSFPNRRTDTRIGNALAPGVPQVAADGVVRIGVPEAVGAGTVIGQLTVDRASDAGYVTAYACELGIPADPLGRVLKSDLNYDGRVMPVASNRLVVQADAQGDVCFSPSSPVDLIIDLNAVTDIGIASFANRRTDTRRGAGAASRPQVAADGTVRVNVPAASGARTVIGQLTVDRTTDPGFVTAYGCDQGLPSDVHGGITRSDLNYDGRVSPVASNRLIVQADHHGDICLHTSAPADMIVDVNAVADGGITSFPNRRTDTRSGTTSTELPGIGAVPEWPPFEPLPALEGVAALTGVPADATITSRAILAVKIDNYRAARPQWGLEHADVIIEENVEGVTRFIALFHSRIPAHVGPVRSARTADLDILAGMNRPTFGYSGANGGVSAWIASAARSGVLVDFTAQRNPCYFRTPERRGPHDLLIEPPCVFDTVTTAGPARPLWDIDAGWSAPDGVATTPDSTFQVAMDGVQIEWRWHPATGRYLRFQDGFAHLTASGTQVSAHNVVEIESHHVPSPVDSRSPNPITVGTGNAVLHRNGQAVAVTWSRLTPYEPFAFHHRATGTPVPLERGTTFVHLVRDR